MSLPTIAEPRQAPFEDSSASSSALMSVPWQLACTSTERENPRYRCSAVSFSLGESGGV